MTAARRRADPVTWGEDHATPDELLAALGPLDHWFLDAIENMNGAGELAPGVRSLGERSGVHPSTAARNRHRVAARGIWERDPELDYHPPHGGAPTHGFRVTQRWLRAAFWLRGQLRPNWNRRWRPQLATVEGVIRSGATKGYSPGRDKKTPSLEPSESRCRAREAGLKNDEGIPVDLKVGKKSETSERSSDAVLPPREAAATPEPKPAPKAKAARFRPVFVPSRPPPRTPAEKTAIGRKQAEKHLRFLVDRCGSRAAAEYLDIVAPTELAGGPQPATPAAKAIFERVDEAMLGALATGIWCDIPAPWYPENGIVPRHAGWKPPRKADVSSGFEAEPPEPEPPPKPIDPAAIEREHRKADARIAFLNRTPPPPPGPFGRRR